MAVGAHTRPTGKAPGRHRGRPAALITADLGRLGAATGVLVVAIGSAVAFAPAAGAASTPSASDWYRLRVCESGDNYAINTGNGYYGAYQFDLATWQGLGYSGYPNEAAPATQDAAALKLWQQRGWAPWPGCAAKLGLGQPAASSPAAPGATVVHRDAPTAAAVSNGVPKFAGPVLSARLVGQRRADVATWQQRMRDRGWMISVDGRFGAQSARIAAAFAAEKSIASGALGQVDAVMWNAAWTSPIT